MEQLPDILQSLLSLLVIAIPIIIAIIVHDNNIKRYKEETYYKITNVSYAEVKHNTGKYGEYLTYKYLKNFEEQGARFLFNIYVPKKDESTTEIDVLMISPKGLFVFESKNYSGWIFGTDTQKYWCQTLPAGRRRSHKEKFYNPIFQNKTHIKYLKSIVGNDIPLFSIITFSDRCTLKDVNTQSSGVPVINRYQVYNLVCYIYNSYPDVLSQDQIENIFNNLYPYSQATDEVKRKHIEDIYYKTHGIKIENTDNQTNETIIEPDTPVVDTTPIINIDYSHVHEEVIQEIGTSVLDNLTAQEEQPIIENTTPNPDESLICPQCGGKLILRTAKRGDHEGEQFYGCSNYPRCKYIQKL